MQHCIESGVAGHRNLVGSHILLEQVVTGLFGSGKMQGRQLGNQEPVHFLGKGLAYVAGTKPRFDMANGQV